MRREDAVLIVEDNPLIAEAIERAGERLQMRTERATDGWEAIEKLENASYGAIFIDTDMPRHSGFGVLTYLREEVGEDLCNVIVMSSDREHLRGKLHESVRVICQDEAVAAMERLCEEG